MKIDEATLQATSYEDLEKLAAAIGALSDCAFSIVNRVGPMPGLEVLGGMHDEIQAKGQAVQNEIERRNY